MTIFTCKKNSPRLPETETLRRRMAAIQRNWSDVERLNRREEAVVMQLRLLHLPRRS
jgi:hypothetical protein